MTVSTQLFRWRYTATAAASTLYPYTNKILDEDDLKVYVEDVLQMIETHYSVTGVGLAAGGQVEFVTAPAEDEEILITKDGVEFTQELDYVENDAFPAEKHEDGLDKLTNIAQKIWDYVGRSIKLPIVSALTDLELPEPEAAKVLAWNSDEDALENVSLVGTGAISDAAYNSGTWDDVDTIAPSKGTMRDKIEIMISDDAYNSTTWDGETTVAPSKNAVRDKLETLDVGDVTAAANIGANKVVIGHNGGDKSVKESVVSISDSGVVTGLADNGIPVEKVDSGIERAILGDATKGRVDRLLYVIINGTDQVNDITIQTDQEVGYTSWNSDLHAIETLTAGDDDTNWYFDSGGTKVYMNNAAITGDPVSAMAVIIGTHAGTKPGIRCKVTGGEIQFWFRDGASGLDLRTLGNFEEIRFVVSYKTSE